MNIWKGYGQKFEDLYNSLAEVALSISLPNTPFTHKIFYYKFTFDKTTWKDKNKFKIDSRIIKIEKLSENADPEKSDFFLEEGKDYRILIDVYGNKYFEFIRTTRVKIKITYNVPFTEYPTLDKGTKFYFNSNEYIELVEPQQGKPDSSDPQTVYMIGYRRIQGDGPSTLLPDGQALSIPDQYASFITAVSVEKDFGEESYLYRLGNNPIPRFLYAEKVYLDTKIIDGNFGAFIDFKNQRDSEDLYALDRVIRGEEDPSTYQFATKYSQLRVEDVDGEKMIVHDPDRILRALELYKLRVNALWFALWNGPSEFNLNVAASIFMGLPISELEGFVKDIYKDYLNRWVVEITDGNSVKKYILPRGITPDVEKGQPITLFQPIAPNAARIYDQFIDEKKFKESMMDLYDVLVNNVEEECGVRFDSGVYFDTPEPCEGVFFDQCETQPIDATYCYVNWDKISLHIKYEIFDIQLEGNRHKFQAYANIVPDGKDLGKDFVIILNNHKAIKATLLDRDVNTKWVLFWADEALNPDWIGEKAWVGPDWMEKQLYMMETPEDCEEDRACTVELENGAISRNFPDDFYENFRYIFLVDILGGITMIDEDYKGLRDFLYRIKPAYAHFLINLILPAEEEIEMDVEEEYQTQLCDLYDEKAIFFDDYLPVGYDPANEYTDPELNFETAEDKRGIFFDDPRWCNVDKFDSGDGHLTDNVEVQQTVELGDLWIFTPDVPSL